MQTMVGTPMCKYYTRRGRSLIKADTHVNFRFTDAAPEVLSYQPYGIKVDIFSFGVMLAEMACRCSGLPQRYVSDQYRKAPKNAVIKKWRVRLPLRVKKKHPLLKTLVEQCWVQDPFERPTFKEIKQELEAIGSHPKGYYMQGTSGYEASLIEQDDEDDDLESFSSERLAEIVRNLYLAGANGQYSALPVDKLAEIVRNMRFVGSSMRE